MSKQMEDNYALLSNILFGLVSSEARDIDRQMKSDDSFENKFEFYKHYESGATYGEGAGGLLDFMKMKWIHLNGQVDDHQGYTGHQQGVCEVQLPGVEAHFRQSLPCVHDTGYTGECGETKHRQMGMANHKISKMD